VEGRVAAAADVRERGDRVAGGDHVRHCRGRAGRRLHHAVCVDRDPGDVGVAARGRLGCLLGGAPL
jgi:hypothetical protein